MDLSQQDLQAPFYDVAGKPMEAKAFRKRYKHRMSVRRSSLLGVRVWTEFVGINHQHDSRRTPLIYETCILAGYVIVHSDWQGGHRRALLRHYWMVLLTALGGAAWWHIRAHVWGQKTDD